MHGLWTKIGEENPALVHRMSNGATKVLANADVRHLLDIFWTRQTMDKTCTLGYSGWAFISHSQLSDIVWTDIGLDKLYTKPRLMAYSLAQAQILDGWAASGPWVGCKWAMGGRQVGHKWSMSGLCIDCELLW